jgi:hypothetical protein
MSHRTSISDLRLAGSANLKRALKYPPKAPKTLAKGPELEELWNDIVARRAEAVAHIKKNGMLINQDRSHAGKIFVVEVVNPMVRVLQTCERQLVQLAKMLTEVAEDEAERPKTPLEELDAIIGRAN